MSKKRKQQVDLWGESPTDLFVSDEDDGFNRATVADVLEALGFDIWHVKVLFSMKLREFDD